MVKLPVVVTAGMSTDASIGTTSDIEIPSMIGGISTGMDERNRLTQQSHPG